MLLPASLLAGMGGWGLTAAGAGAETLAQHYETGLVSVGLLTAVFAIAYAGLQVPAGHLIDRFGVRGTALAGAAITAGAYVAALALPSVAGALVARGVAGAGSAVGFVAGAELARRSATGTTGLGVFGGFGIGAGGLAVVVVPRLEAVVGWGATWITCVAVAIGTAIVVGVVVPSGHDGRPASHPSAIPRPPLLRDGELYRLTAIHASTFGLAVVLGNWAAVIFTSNWGLSSAASSVIASMILALTIISRPIGGAVLGRYPGSVGVLTMTSLVVCAAGTLLLAFPSGLALAVAATVAVGIAGGLPFAAALAGAQRWRTDRPAAAVGVLNGWANLVVVLGTPLVASAIERGAVTQTLLVMSGLWLVPLFMMPRTFKGLPAHS